MCLWSVALKARKAGNRPRTFFAGRTVALDIMIQKSEKIGGEGKTVENR